MFSKFTLKETGKTANCIIYLNKKETKIYNEKEKEELIQKYGFVVPEMPASFNHADSNLYI